MTLGADRISELAFDAMVANCMLVSFVWDIVACSVRSPAIRRFSTICVPYGRKRETMRGRENQELQLPRRSSSV